MYAYYRWIQGMNWNYLIDLDVIRRNHLQVTPVAHGYGEDFTYTIDLPTYVSGAVLLPDITYQYYIRSSSTQIKKKKILSHEQFMLSIDAVNKKKARKELKGKPYYAKRISLLMMIDCSFACEMLKKRADFDVPFKNCEIRDVMWHPMSLWEILTSNSARKQNLFYYLIGKLPLVLSILLLRLMVNRYS
jgi:hypothetical protein